MAGYRGLARVIEKRRLLTRSARIRSLASQDDGRRASEANYRIAGERRPPTTPIEAEDPKRAENESEPVQHNSGQPEREAHTVHDAHGVSARHQFPGVKETTGAPCEPTPAGKSLFSPEAALSGAEHQMIGPHIQRLLPNRQNPSTFPLALTRRKMF